MTLPVSVADREVILGGGPAGATYAATRRAMGFQPPIILDPSRTMGGVFAKLVDFGMNSADNASVASVFSPGPTRILPMSLVDTQNYLPNSIYQVEDSSPLDEYPHSFNMAKAVRKTAQEYAECYTQADYIVDGNAQFFTKAGVPLGRARRVIFAGGLVDPQPVYPKCTAIVPGLQFLKDPVRKLGGLKIAVVGSGATGASIVEFMLATGLTKPQTRATNIHWFGGGNMPVSKSEWMLQYHARFSALGHHFPQDGVGGGAIRPYPVLGNILPLGKDIAWVNGEIFDLVIQATGLIPADCPVATPSNVQTGSLILAKCSSAEDPLGSRFFKIGSAAQINQPYGPYKTRFAAATLALSNQLSRVAALAAVLPR